MDSRTRADAPDERYRALLEAVARAKRDDPLAPVTVLVPNHATALDVRRAVGRRGVAVLRVTTPAGLAEELAAPTLLAGDRRPLTPEVRCAAARAELAADPLGFATVAELRPTAVALAGASASLRALPDSALDALAADPAPLVRDTVALHRRIRHRLAWRWFDVRDLAEEAARRIAAGRPDIGEIVLFQLAEDDLAPADRTVVAALRAAGSVTDLPPVIDPEPMGELVVHAPDADDEVRAAARLVIAELAAGTPAHRVAVAYADPEPYGRLLRETFDRCEIPVHTTDGPGLDETPLGRTVLRLLDWPAGGHSRREFMAVAADGALRVEGRRPPLGRWERLTRGGGPHSVVVVGGNDWDRLADVRAVGGLPGEEPTADDPGPDPEAGRLLDTVRDLRARLDALDHAPTWRAVADGLTELVGKYLTRPRGESVPPAETWAHDELAGLIAGLPDLDTGARLDAGAALDTGPDAAGAATPGLAAIHDVLADDMARRHGGRGVQHTGVTLGALDRIAGRDLDLLVVVGLAEGVTPRPRREDPLLPDRVRALTDGALPTLVEAAAAQHRTLLTALGSARRRVLTFPRGSLRSGGRHLPSRWLLPTLRVLTGDPKLTATEWQKGAEGCPAVHNVASFDDAIRTGTPTVEAEPINSWEWRLHAALDAAPEPAARPELADDLVLVLARTARADRRLGRFTRFTGHALPDVPALPGRPARDEDPARGAALRAWLGSWLADPVAPTTLEAWSTCPHAFFLHHLLGVQPLADPEEVLEIDPLTRGSLVHVVLESAIEAERRGEGTGPGGVVSAEQLVGIADRAFSDLEAGGDIGAPTLWAHTRTALLADLEAWRTAEESQRAEGWHPVAAEHRFGARPDPDHPDDPVGDPVTVTLPGGRELSLVGTIDRLDRGPDGALRVTDYKTGSPRPYDGLSASDPTLGGHRLQLVGYALAAGAGTPGAPAVTSRYWFVTRSGKFTEIGYPVDDAVLDLARDSLAAIVRGVAAGVFPAVPDDRCEYCAATGRPGLEAQRAGLAGDPALSEYVVLDPEA